MKFPKNKSFLIIFSLLICILLVNCGKVTQDVSKKKILPSFKLNFSIPIDFSQTKIIKSDKKFDINDKTLYSSLTSLDENNKMSMISWGKASLIKKEPPKVTSPNLNQSLKPIYLSQSYNKQGLKISKPNKGEIFIKLDPKLKTWKINIDKIRIFEPPQIYLASFYSSQKNAYLAILENDMVSANKTVVLDDINQYTTFIASIFLIARDDVSSSFESSKQLLVDLKKLFTEELFIALGEPLIRSSNKNWSVKKPIFKFINEKSNLIQLYLDIYRLTIADTNAAVKFIDGVKNSILDTQSKNIFKKNIKQFNSKKK